MTRKSWNYESAKAALQGMAKATSQAAWARDNGYSEMYVYDLKKQLQKIVETRAPKPAPKAVVPSARPRLAEFDPSRLRTALAAKGVGADQAALATQQPVRAYLTGQYAPYTDGPVQRLCDYLGVPFTALQKSAEPAPAVEIRRLASELERERSAHGRTRLERDQLKTRLATIERAVNHG